MLLGNGGRSNLGIESLITALSPLFTSAECLFSGFRGKCIHPARRCFALHEGRAPRDQVLSGFSDWAMIASERLFLCCCDQEEDENKRQYERRQGIANPTSS